MVHSQQREWNGRDFYMVLGRSNRLDDRWSIARRYGLLNAGGRERYWRPLEKLTRGARVFAYVGGHGYVGIGRVAGAMDFARDAEVEIDGELQSLLDQPELSERYPKFWAEAVSDDPEVSQVVVPVDWLSETRPLHQAVWQKRLFANQNTVCKIRDERTVDVVESAFGLNVVHRRNRLPTL